MEIIKAWTLSVCMACVIAGILCQFTQAKSKFSVIKLVLTLYILITAFTPLQMLRYPDTRFDIPVLAPVETEIDTNILLAAHTQKILERTVQRACKEAQCPIVSCTVTLTRSEFDFTVREVAVWPAQGSADETIRKTVQEALESDVPVVVQKEG
ncbi:MAG: hypothetical protein RSC73_07095 [Ruthenibacterium sp.]